MLALRVEPGQSDTRLKLRGKWDRGGELARSHRWRLWALAALCWPHCGGLQALFCTEGFLFVFILRVLAELYLPAA